MKDPLYRQNPMAHRSCGWRPLRGETEEKPRWVSTFLIPQLTRETGVSWKSAGGNLLHSDECQIFLPDYSESEKDFWKSVRKRNEVINFLKKLYSVVDLEYEIGFFLMDSSGCDEEGFWCYRGFWALSTQSILKRGKLIGERFGL